jgi:WD40 repeat protein
LVALGVGMYQFQSPAPMCVIDDDNRAVSFCFAAEGRRLVTTSKRRKDPLIVWDARTGHEIMRLPNKGQKLRLNATAFSKDGRYVAAEIREYGDDEKERHNDFHSIFLADMLADTVRELPLVDTLNAETLRFSPKGDLLLRSPGLEENVLRIWDTSTGDLVDQRPSDGSGDFLGDAYVHAIPNDKGYTIVEVWSLLDRTPVATFHNVGQYGGWGCAGHYYVGQRWADDHATGTWGIWNLNTYRLEAEFDTTADYLRAASSDGRWLVFTGKDTDGKYVELRALPSGKIARVFRPAGFTIEWVFFSPDGQFLFMGDYNEPGLVAVLDLPEMNVLWKHPVGSLRGLHFSPDSSTVQFFMTDDRQELRCLECATGRPRAMITLPKLDVFLENPMDVSRDGRTILLRRVGEPKPTWPEWLQQLPWLNWPAEAQIDTIVLVDAESCRERFRMHSEPIASFLLSEDGRTLATVHEAPDGGRVVYCWDVDAWKPLHWAIGVPAGLALLAAHFAWWGRRWVRSSN